ncbi:MAG TPA: carbohydrate porin [Bacteroidota bacterium]|nr:carbohydrate porin [Bacteroidota bacterium]
MISSSVAPLVRLGVFILLTSSILAAQTAPDSSEVWSYHFQFTGIQQFHGDFTAPYSGLNSLKSSAENPLSVTSTLYFGRRLWTGGEAYADPELSGGSGFSSTRGVAGFPNGEVYRVDDPSPKVIMARMFLRQTISLDTNGSEPIEADQNQLAGTVSPSRLTITLGKFSLTDIFDDNAYSHDARTQFMNWALWSPAAWDYAADTHGYDWGAAFELHRPDWILNFAAVLEPTTANGPDFDHNIHDAYSLNAEIVKPYAILPLRGKIHVIAFYNRARMGNYLQSIEQAAAAGTTPDVTSTREYSAKYGFAATLEQPISKSAGVFSRFSWDDGKTETWAFTEVDRSFHAGVLADGEAWNRAEDHVGLAYDVNALSQDHSDYLAAGGYGFLIGDGKLNYGLEQIIEAFYNAKVSPSFWLTLDNQAIINPGYNKDRGPLVNAFAVRGHVEM